MPTIVESPQVLEDSATHFSNTGVLLLHGLTGTPSEMKPLAKYLKKQGFRVESPMIAGHGQGHREILATTWQDWLDSVKKAFDDLAKECDQVFVAGLSMGALLTILLAVEDVRVDGIILLSMDLGIPGPDIPFTHHLLPLGFAIPLMRRYCYWTEKPPYGLRDTRLQKMITRSIEAAKRGETDQYGLFRTYVGSLHQMHKLIKVVLQNAHQASCPTLLIHSLEDTMLSAANATKIYAALGSQQKNITLINGCDHVMTVDLRKDEIARLTGNFIKNILEEQCQQSSKYEVA